AWRTLGNTSASSYVSPAFGPSTTVTVARTASVVPKLVAMPLTTSTGSITSRLPFRDAHSIPEGVAGDANWLIAWSPSVVGVRGRAARTGVARRLRPGRTWRRSGQRVLPFGDHPV